MTSKSNATSLEYLPKNTVTLTELVLTKIMKGLVPAGDVYAPYVQGGKMIKDIVNRSSNLLKKKE